MAKRKQVKVSSEAVKTFLILLILVASLIWLFQIGKNFLLTSSYFKINDIVFEDPQLQFIDIKDLNRLKGRSIFSVNSKELQKILAGRYPQVGDLKIVKIFPNQISIEAKKRWSLGQINFKSKFYVLDPGGVILNELEAQDSAIPLITGVKLNVYRLGLGMVIKDPRIQTALSVIKQFRLNDVLSRFKLTRIDVTNLSTLEIFLVNDFKIILDRDNVKEKMTSLGQMFSNGQLDFRQYEYIDLRFKDPVLGKKIE